MPSKGSENQKENGAALYIVATPIGNLKDITFRAVDTLKSADIIICEDTRVSKKLLNHYGIQGKLQTYHEHNAAVQRPKILEKLMAGESIALISDAGTPLISDPGYKLVEEALEAGMKVVPIPGASAVMSSLMAAGLPTDQFAFLGFLPVKTSHTEELLAPWKQVPATLVCFSTPGKLQGHVQALVNVLGDGKLVIARELTKMYEEFISGQASDILKDIDGQEKMRGEIVLAFHKAPSEQSAENEQAEALLRELLNMLPVKSAVDVVVKHYKLPKNQIYTRALEIKNGR